MEFTDIFLLKFLFSLFKVLQAFLIAQLVKNSPAVQDSRFNSWVSKIPCRRDRLPTPICLGFPCGSAGKESAFNAGDLGSISGFGRFPWRREWLSTPVFWPGEFHGQRSLQGYSPWGCQESDMTE